MAGEHKINVAWQVMSFNNHVLLVEGRVIKVEDGRSEKLSLPHDEIIVVERNDLQCRRLSRLRSWARVGVFDRFPPGIRQLSGLMV